MVGRFCREFKVGEPEKGVECMPTLQCFNLQVVCVQRLRCRRGFFGVLNHGHNAAAATTRLLRLTQLAVALLTAKLKITLLEDSSLVGCDAVSIGTAYTLKMRVESSSETPVNSR